MRGWRGPTPERPFPSLGWQILQWTFAYLPSPSDETKPLVYTDEQAREIVRWHEIHPLTGEYVHTTLILEELKGWGKSPFAATLDITEFRGPVCFDGWDANGEPVGVPWGTGDRPSPWIQIAALSEDQTANTYGALYAMLASRSGKIADDLGIDLGRTRLYLPDQPAALLEPVTASSGSRTGQRITKATLDETWLWRRDNGGTKLAATLRFNLAKTNGRAVETTNAPILGQRSVAEQSDPDRPIAGVLHFAHRARTTPDPSWSDERLEATLREIHGDLPWIHPERYVRDIRDPRTAWDDALRLFFNLRTSGSGRAVDPRLWDLRRLDRGLPPAGARIGLGFDGSISQDATVLRGCTEDGHSFRVASWEKPAADELIAWFSDHPGADEWTVTRSEVKQAVREAFATWDVGLMLCDTPKWRTEIEGWAAEFGAERVLAFDTNQARRFAPAVDRWLTGLREGTHTHDGDPLCDRHVKAAHLKVVRLEDGPDDGRTKVVLVKGDDHGRIDGAVTDVLAYEAAMTMPPAVDTTSVYESRGFLVLRAQIDCPDCGRETVVRRSDRDGWRCPTVDGGCGQIFDEDDDRIVEQFAEVP